MQPSLEKNNFAKNLPRSVCRLVSGPLQSVHGPWDVMYFLKAITNNFQTFQIFENVEPSEYFRILSRVEICPKRQETGFEVSTFFRLCLSILPQFSILPQEDISIILHQFSLQCTHSQTLQTLDV